jgi:hypothetical protein
MKKILATIVSLLVLVPALAAADTIIHMTENGFEPSSVKIEGPDRVVVFKNVDVQAHWPASNIHPTHGLYPDSHIDKCGTSDEAKIFDACRPIQPGESYVFTMQYAGDWTYHDHENPEFTGNIVIVGTSTAAYKKPSKSLWSRFTHFIARTVTRLSYTLNPGKLEKELSEADMIALASADGAGIRKWIEIIGPTEVMTRMNNQKMSTGLDCHQPAHAVGRQSYEVYGDKVFTLCSAECHSGCYHGAAEAYFREHGADNLEKDLNVICSSSLNAFFSHQCLHGVGHGLMAWSGYDIFKALKSCDLLSSQKDSCLTGVFMENIVGGLAVAHKTKYLNEDPQYPCSIMPDQYKSSCYFLQTSRMMQLFGGDFKKIAAACGKAPAPYQSVCFQSMGRDVGGSNPGNPKGAIAACDNATGQNRSDCLNGAIQDTFWDASGADVGLNFCRTLTMVEDKTQCYNLQFGRATQVFTSSSDIKNFCGKAEKEYQHLCSVGR